MKYNFFFSVQLNFKQNLYSTYDVKVFLAGINILDRRDWTMKKSEKCPWKSNVVDRPSPSVRVKGKKIMRFQTDGLFFEIILFSIHFPARSWNRFRTLYVVKATCHCVTTYRENEDRYSWPFFLGLSADAILDPLPDFNYNRPNFKMLPSKMPKPSQTFNEWFVENVTEAADVVDTTGKLWSS